MIQIQEFSEFLLHKASMLHSNSMSETPDFISQ